MRVAVLSDVHANLEALDAVLERADALGARRFFVLGDLVGYGADPNAVIERLTASDATMICGNHDLAATGGFDLSWFNDAAAAAIEWTTRVLSAASTEVLAGLSPLRDVDGTLLVHGSVRDPVAEYLLGTDDARASFGLRGFDLAFFGHTHLPTVFACDPDGRVRGWVLPEDRPLPIEPGVRYLLNPGSVGQPRDGDARASFLMCEEGGAVLHRVRYPIERAQRKIREAGLPAWLADRLAVGQ